MQQHLPVAAATVELSPAFQSRAKLTWSLRDREDGCCIYFSKTINPWLNSRRRYAAGRDEQMDKVESEHSPPASMVVEIFLKPETRPALSVALIRTAQASADAHCCLSSA